MLTRLNLFRWGEKNQTRNTPANESKAPEGDTVGWALEPRFMFDAAGVASGAELAEQQAAEDALGGDGADDAAATEDEGLDYSEAFAGYLPPSEHNEVVFIDGSVDNYQDILGGIDPQAEIIVIHPDGNGLQQIASALQGRSDVDAIHIISHGAEGELQLGNLTLSVDNLNDSASTLGEIGESLTADGDILFYGCSLGGGAQGDAFISALGEMTGADIAASNDDTGSADRGGDWDLELAAGTIETAAISAPAFGGLLMTQDCSQYPPDSDAYQICLDGGDPDGFPGDGGDPGPGGGGNEPPVDQDAGYIPPPPPEPEPEGFSDQDIPPEKTQEAFEREISQQRLEGDPRTQGGALGGINADGRDFARFGLGQNPDLQGLLNPLGGDVPGDGDSGNDDGDQRDDAENTGAPPILEEEDLHVSDAPQQGRDFDGAGEAIAPSDFSSQIDQASLGLDGDIDLLEAALNRIAREG